MADGDIVIVVNGVSFVEDSSERTIPAAILVSPSVAARYCSGRVVKIHPDNVQHWRDAGYLPTLDPWALPAGLEWYVIGDNWAVRTVDGQSLRSHGITIEVLLQDLAARRNADDPPNASGRISGGPSAQSIPRARVTCHDCHGTRVYVGLGFFPVEPCRTCGGTGKVYDWSVPAPQLRPPEGPVEADPWALPPEAVAAGLAWRKGLSWEVNNWTHAARTTDVQIFQSTFGPDKGALSGPTGDLDPDLVLRLFDLIQRRNVAEP